MRGSEGGKKNGARRREKRNRKRRGETSMDTREHTGSLLVKELNAVY